MAHLGAETQLVEGFPPPPAWFNEASKLLPPDADLNPPGDVFYTSLSLEEIHKTLPPPPLPSGDVWVFGASLSLAEVAEIQPLDSDTKLYSDSSGADGRVPELRDEFKRLLEDMMDETGELMGQCSQFGYPGIGNIGGKAKQVMKTYRNLHHILSILRGYQFYQVLADRLEDQFQHRLSLVNDVRRIAFNMPPLTVDDVVNSSGKEARQPD